MVDPILVRVSVTSYHLPQTLNNSSFSNSDSGQFYQLDALRVSILAEGMRAELKLDGSLVASHQRSEGLWFSFQCFSIFIPIQIYSWRENTDYVNFDLIWEG